MIERPRLGNSQPPEVVQAPRFIRADNQIPQTASEMGTRSGKHHPGQKLRVIGIRSGEYESHHAVMIAVTVVRSITC